MTETASLVPMDPVSWVAAFLLVWVSFAVFLGGMAWRIWQWSRTPKTPVALGMYPKPASGGARFAKLLKDTFVFPQVREVDWKIWVFALLFHVALLGAFVGHLRLLREWTPLVELLGQEGMDSLGAWAGSIAGTLALVGLAYYVLRRIYGHYKDISVPEDYLLLFLLAGIIIMGDHMRFFGEIHAAEYREYFLSVLRFEPGFPAILDSSPTKWSLVTHVLFADLLLIYFPWSKLVHTVGAFATNLIRSE
jgi:nitrate reductase gamma subunit